MSNALLSDVEARSVRRRTRTSNAMWQDLVNTAWKRARDATDPAEARRWLERAHRMASKDGTLAVTLAGARLSGGDLAGAKALFQAQAEAGGGAECWLGLATCALLRADTQLALHALAALLRSGIVNPTVEALAARALPSGRWCGMTTTGEVVTGAAVSAARLDGVALPVPRTARRLRLPDGWRNAATLEIEGADGPMLGSPLPVAAFARVEGFVEAQDGGVSGWAWLPADPDADPQIAARGPHGTRNLVLSQPAEGVTLDRPLARPRRLALTAAEVAALGEPLSLLGPDGRHLLGSPLEPGIEARAAAGSPGFTPVWADVIGAPPTTNRRAPPVDVVIPVYRGRDETLACIDSVRASLPRGTRLIVVDDASPDPALVAALDGLARTRRIVLVRLPENRGFPGAANAGLRAAAGRDVVLLNSDTLVAPGWLQRLRAAAYSGPDIGTATPLTNDGTIVSYPDRGGGNPAPDLAGTIALDALAQQANPGQVAELPVGVGLCLYLRRDCLDDVGLLREDLFAQGYGEENDLCLRARHRGWRSVAALDVFVAHVGATSFGAARAHLVRRNGAILARLHPGYDALVARHIAADLLGPARHRMDALRWAAARQRAGSVVFVTHAGGGGVERVVQERAAAVASAGRRPIILRPGAGGSVQVEQPGAAFPNLVFPMPVGLRDLARLLRADRVKRVELHHFLGHHHSVAGLPKLLGAEAVSVVHDYARFCGRIALVGISRRYCGEPDVPGCEACIADAGSLLEDDPPIPDLLARSGAELRAAALVIAPSADAAARIGRHFPGVKAVVEPWEDDTRLPPLKPAQRDGALRVVIVGAIGVEKGLDILLACTRDARARSLPITFTVVGFTADDERVMAAGPVFVTGEYREAEAVELIREQGAQLALLPSIWPETWCFALSRVWQAGLPAAVFDIGAQAERVRRTGRGWVLPLGLSAQGLNDALLRLAPGALASQCPRV
jgi:GT2 family glycosyltransferase/glycosyltransferase involved in cell wall biosynthesis